MSKTIGDRPRFQDQFKSHKKRGLSRNFKRDWIGDDFRPVVFPAQVAELFAPLKHCDVKEISIRRDPELFGASRLADLIPSSVEGQVSETVAREDSNPTKTLAACHEQPNDAHNRRETAARSAAVERPSSCAGWT